MMRFWWRMGDSVLNTSAASQWSWREVRAHWHCWGWHWKVLATEHKWNYSEGNEWCDEVDCTGLVKSSVLSLLLYRYCWLSWWFAGARSRQRWRRAGSVVAAVWRWWGEKSLADPHLCGWHGSQKGCHYAARKHQKWRLNMTALFYQREPVTVWQNIHSQISWKILCNEVSDLLSIEMCWKHINHRVKWH